MILLAVIILLQIADAWTTFTAISSGKGKEANPLMAGIIDKFSYMGLYVVKLLGCIFFVFVYRKFGQLFLVPAIAYYIWIVFNNYRVIRGK